MAIPAALTPMMPQTVAIVGAGLIGRAWSVVFARAGWRVRLHDADGGALERAMPWIRDALAAEVRAGLLDEAARERAATAVTAHADFDDALAGADWVQECGPEIVEVKAKLFDRFDRATKASAILASSTSAIVASRFTEALEGRARCLVAHPVNPPHLVPVVELCGAPWTSKETLERARDVMTSLGQVPVTVRREIDGFVLNRLQGALLSEAMRLVGDGVISPEDLDATVHAGLGCRWSFMGPFATIDLNAPGGVADYAARYAAFYRRLAADPPTPQVWDEDYARRVNAALGPATTDAQRQALTAWRDERLLALRSHQRTQPRPTREEKDET